MNGSEYAQTGHITLDSDTFVVLREIVRVIFRGIECKKKSRIVLEYDPQQEKMRIATFMTADEAAGMKIMISRDGDHAAEDHHSIQQESPSQCHIVPRDAEVTLHLHPDSQSANLESATRLCALLGTGHVLACMPEKVLPQLQENQP